MWVWNVNLGQMLQVDLHELAAQLSHLSYAEDMNT